MNSSSSVLTPQRERLLLIVLALVQFSHIVDFMIIMPLGPRLMTDFGISPAQFGALVSAYTFSAGICGFLAAPVLDRFTRRRALFFSFLGFILGTAVCGIAHGYHWLMLARIVAGGFGGVSGSLILATVSDAVPMQRRGAAIGTIMMSFSLASVMGVPLGLTAADHLAMGWRAPFLLLSAFSLLLLVLVAVAMPHVTRTPRAAGESLADSLKAVFSVPRHWIAFGFTAALMFSGFVIITYLSPSLVGNAGLENHQLKYIYMVGGLCTFVSMPLIGKLGDRFGLFRVFTVVALLSMPFMWIITHLGRVGLIHVLPLTTLFMILVSGRVAPGFTLVTGAVEPRHRGGFLSVNTAIQQIASGFAAMVAGVLVVRAPDGGMLHYEWAGYLGIGVLLLSIFLASKIRHVPKA